jgi:predicted transposase YdaD
MERGRSWPEIKAVLAALIDWLKASEQQSLRRAFAVWLSKVILAKLPGGETQVFEDLQEMQVRIEDRFREWNEEFERKGRQEGRQEGEALLLRRQLGKRFGELPEWVWPRLQQAQPEQLERWGERLLDADSLPAVFDGE